MFAAGSLCSSSRDEGLVVFDDIAVVDSNVALIGVYRQVSEEFRGDVDRKSSGNGFAVVVHDELLSLVLESSAWLQDGRTIK